MHEPKYNPTDSEASTTKPYTPPEIRTNVEVQPDAASVDLDTETIELISRNREILSQNPEISEFLLPYYEVALSRFPILAHVAILGTDGSGRIAQSRNRFNAENKTGHHEVIIDLSDGILERIISELHQRPTTKQIIAVRMGEDQRRLTPQKLLSHVFLHELGHALENMLRGDDPESAKTIREERRAEMLSLPLPEWSSTSLLDPAEQAKILAHVPDLFERLGVSNFSQVCALQEAAYRRLPKEKYADDFASAIMLGSEFPS
ncbi:MAG: hypothetical protein WCO19_03420 [Candidatus Saccharibacteria bacterium]